MKKFRFPDQHSALILKLLQPPHLRRYQAAFRYSGVIVTALNGRDGAPSIMRRR